ncbi:MAG: hypothetical protein Q9195_003846 [Heterodermia aff. obscurata]
MAPSAPIQDIRQLCNLYITDIPPTTILAIFITIAVINAVIFFSLWLPLIISLNIQSHHRLKRLSEIVLRHKPARFIVWPFLHASCGLSLIIQGLVLHAGLTCRHPGVKRRVFSLTPVAGWLLFASQCTILTISTLAIGFGLRKEQKKARKGKGRATAGEGDVGQHGAELFAMPPSEGSLRAFRNLGSEDQYPRPSTVTTNSSRSSRPEYFCWEGIEDLTKEQAKRARSPVGRNAEGSSRDVERLVAREHALAADIEGFPFPRMPERCFSPLASESLEEHSQRLLGTRQPAPMGRRSFMPSRPSPLRIVSGYSTTSDRVTATVPGSCRLDKLRGTGKVCEAVVFEMTVPPNEDVLISLSRVTTSYSTTGLEPLQRCPQLPSPDTHPI